jgi:hypothetical protein
MLVYGMPRAVNEAGLSDETVPLDQIVDRVLFKIKRNGWYTPVGRITPSLIPPITPNEFELLRSLIEVECGIVVEKGKEYLIESRLSGLAVENACRSFGDFYLKAKKRHQRRLRDQIVDAMTTNETMWFRDRGPFDILEQCSCRR